MEEYRKVDNYDAIMQLDIACNEEGQQLFHSLEWAKKENIVVVWRGQEGWMRGKGNVRYRVIMTLTPSKHAFPRHKYNSGRIKGASD